MSELQGGDFASGALAAGASSFVYSKLGSFVSAKNPAAAYTLNVVTRATVGGTIAELGGGKFKNGAMTAAYSAMITGSINNSRYTKSGFTSPNQISQYAGRGHFVAGIRELDAPVLRDLGVMWAPAAGGLLDGTTKMLAHEQAFGTTSQGAPWNLGYSPQGEIPEGFFPPNSTAPFNNIPASSFLVDPARYVTPIELEQGRPIPGFASGDDYRLFGRNCQEYVRTLQRSNGSM